MRTEARRTRPTRRHRLLDGMQPRIAVAVLADTLGAGAFYPLILVYLHLTTPYPLSRLGLVLTVGSVAGLTLGPFTGGLVDRFGARRVLVLNNVVSAAGYSLLLVIGSVPQLLVAVLLIAVSERLYWAAWPVFVAERVEGRRMDRWYAIMNAVRSASLGGGAAIAAAALAIGGTGVLRGLLLFNVATSLLAAVLVGGAEAARPTARPGDDGDRGWRLVLADRRLLALIVAHTSLAFGWLIPGLALPIYIVETLDLPGWWAAAAFALNTVVTTGAQRWVVDRVAPARRTRVVAAGAVAVLLCVLALALANGPAGWVAAGLLVAGVLSLSLGECLVGPAVNALVMSLPPERLRGRYSSMFGISWTLPSVVGPGVVGVLLDWNVWALWWVFGALVAAGALGFLVAERHLPAQALSVTGPEEA